MIWQHLKRNLWIMIIRVQESNFDHSLSTINKFITCFYESRIYKSTKSYFSFLEGCKKCLFLLDYTVILAYYLISIFDLNRKLLPCSDKSLSEALLFAGHGENMLCAKIVLNVRKNFCTQHVLSRFQLGIFMY